MVQETLSQRLLQLKKEKNFNKNPNKPQLTVQRFGSKDAGEEGFSLP